MRRAAAVTLLGLLGCGGPSAPTVAPTPPPVVYPNMLGGWAGNWTQTYATPRTNGDSVCADLWIVTGQSEGSFSGTFQRSGEGVCPGNGTISGSVTPSGDVRFSYTANGGPLLCRLIAGSGTFVGVVSPAGGLTARAAYNLHCEGAQYGAGTDYAVVATYAMNRR